jgi:HSP20 family protein
MLIRFEHPRTLDLVEDIFSSNSFDQSYGYPLIDVAEKENETVVIAELPGVKKEDVGVTFEDNVLTIKGERKPYEIPEDSRVLLNEVRVRNFSRSITLAHEVDADKISAELNDGILRIVLPKSEKAKPRTIELK